MSRTGRISSMKTPRYTTKMNLYIRILVAGYVVYLAYSLIPGLKEATGSEFIWMAIATSVMAFAGILIVAFAVKSLIKKEYYDADEIERLEDERKAEEEQDSGDETIVDAETVDSDTENANIENTDE